MRKKIPGTRNNVLLPVYTTCSLCVGISAHHFQADGTDPIMSMRISVEEGRWIITVLAVNAYPTKYIHHLCSQIICLKKSHHPTQFEGPEMQQSVKPESEQPEIFGEAWHFQRGLRLSNPFSTTSLKLSMPEFCHLQQGLTLQACYMQGYDISNVLSSRLAHGVGSVNENCCW